MLATAVVGKNTEAAGQSTQKRAEQDTGSAQNAWVESRVAALTHRKELVSDRIDT